MRDGVPAVTDGPFVEAKEHLAGYYVVDCESIERATEIAARCRTRGSARDRGAAGHGRRRDGDVSADARVEDLLRELAPQVLGALVRRYGQFDACEDAVQEALLAAAVQWPRDGRAGQPARLADHGRRRAG